MRNSKSLETLVGLFVCLFVGAAFILTFRVSNLAGPVDGGGYRVTALFENIGGLRVGTSIKLAGLKVGKVVDISIDPTLFEAVVEMEIASKYDMIPADSSASIRTAGLLGEQYISLTPGGDTKPLKEGDKIRFTESALVLEQIIGQFLYSQSAENKAKNKPEPDPLEDF